MNGCEPPHGFWEPNSGSLPGQHMLLTIKLSLHPPPYILKQGLLLNPKFANWLDWFTLRFRFYLPSNSITATWHHTQLSYGCAVSGPLAHTMIMLAMSQYPSLIYVVQNYYICDVYYGNHNNWFHSIWPHTFNQVIMCCNNLHWSFPLQTEVVTYNLNEKMFFIVQNHSSMNFFKNKCGHTGILCSHKEILNYDIQRKWNSLC